MNAGPKVPRCGGKVLRSGGKVPHTGGKEVVSGGEGIGSEAQPVRHRVQANLTVVGRRFAPGGEGSTPRGRCSTPGAAGAECPGRVSATVDTWTGGGQGGGRVCGAPALPFDRVTWSWRRRVPRGNLGVFLVAIGADGGIGRPALARRAWCDGGVTAVEYHLGVLRRGAGVGVGGRNLMR